jgi:hypothetical protein
MCAMRKAAVLSILFAVVLLSVAGIAQTQQTTKVPQIAYFSAGSAPSPTTSGMGPLRVSTSNPRYFMDGGGKTIYLAGWNNGLLSQDNVSTEQAPQIANYTSYINDLKQHNLNHIRFWVFEHTKNSPSDLQITSPMPWSRSDFGAANDGQSKFDLNNFDQAYFDRMRSRVIQARDQGIYVSIMLFQGWSIQSNDPSLDPWRYHPFNPANNINGIDGDSNNNNQGTEIHTLAIPQVTVVQEAYVRKVIDTVNDLDNVLYEISNESPRVSKDWQYHMVNYIKNYQAGKSKQHPVGMTALYDPIDGNNSLNASAGDWISPGAVSWSSPSDPWVSNPPQATGNKVSNTDSDHIISADASLGDPNLARNWIWKSFMRGHNVSEVIIIPTSMGGTHPKGDNPNWTTFRKALGHTRNYSERIHLAATSPRGDLTSTTYALADPGAEYLVYAPGGGSFSVNLVSGTYNYEWFNPVTEGKFTGSISAGNGNHTFSAPFSGDALLYLKSISVAQPTPPPPLPGSRFR